MSSELPPKKEFVTAYEPDFSLNKKIGATVDLAKIFTPERIAGAQQVIDESKKSFFADIESELVLLEQQVNETLHVPEEQINQMEAISYHAHNIYGQAQLLGFTFICMLCKHIVSYAENKDFHVHVRKNLISSLFQALRLAIKEHIIDEGGVIGKDLVLQLKKHTTIK